MSFMAGHTEKFTRLIPRRDLNRPYSITSSARTSSIAGMSMPSNLAVFRLRISLKIENKPELARLLDAQVSWSSPAKDEVYVICTPTIHAR
jgi:hypothetical protein